MSSNSLLVSDFDGVIVDGVAEYWESSYKAYRRLLGDNASTSLNPESIPAGFRQIRPWVNHGWEMVLIAAELDQDNSPLIDQGVQNFSTNYHFHCQEALKNWNWSPEQLQTVLEDIRREAIRTDRNHWLASHRAFPGVVQRMNRFGNENCDLAVLTTKGREFTIELLDHLQLKANLVFGHESGNKAEVLLKISKERNIIGFIEDRRATLETALKTPGLEYLPYYLVSWGYIKPQDTQGLPKEISILEPKTFAAPLASWT